MMMKKHPDTYFLLFKAKKRINVFMKLDSEEKEKTQRSIKNYKIHFAKNIKS